MNVMKIGTEFEKEAYEILKTKFDKVKWLSKNKKSPFDFKCVNDGKVFYGEAKFLTKKAKPTLTFSQKDSDFVIMKVNDKITLLTKEHFEGNVYIQKNRTKAIKISDETWKRLSKMKTDLECKNLGEVIEKILKVVPTNKLK